MPTKDVRDMLKHVEASMPGVYCKLDIVPICSCVGIDVSAFPDMEYTVDGKKYFMPKESLMLKSGDACYMKIMHNPTLPFYLLGLNFFQNYYTIFDQENKRLGFAESIHAHPRVRELRELSEGVQHLFSEEVSNGKPQNNKAIIIGSTMILLVAAICAFKKLTKVGAKKNKDQYQALASTPTAVQPVINSEQN